VTVTRLLYYILNVSGSTVVTLKNVWILRTREYFHARFRSQLYKLPEILCLADISSVVYLLVMSFVNNWNQLTLLLSVADVGSVRARPSATWETSTSMQADWTDYIIPVSVVDGASTSSETAVDTGWRVTTLSSTLDHSRRRRRCQLPLSIRPLSTITSTHTGTRASTGSGRCRCSIDQRRPDIVRQWIQTTTPH